VSLIPFLRGVRVCFCVHPTEIFPGFVRSAASSIAIATMFAFLTLFTFVLPVFDESSGYLAVFILFTVLSTCSVFVLYLFAPETRGVDLEESYKLVGVACNESWGIVGLADDIGDGDDEGDGKLGGIGTVVRESDTLLPTRG
jgi:Sugar (and other) transporter